MAYDGLVAGAIARYLNEILAGGKIDKIYHPDAEELIFIIHAGRERHRLYISSNGGHARMHLLGEDRELANPQNPTAFCMLLRKHFQGGRITEIRQVQSERIIELHVTHVDELGFTVNKRLAVEIMGKHSNVIAIDESSGKIIDCIKRIPPDLSRYRQLLPGLPYVYPPGHNKVCFYTITEETLAEIMENTSASLPKALVEGIQGVSPVISEEICRIAVQSASRDAEALTAADLLKVMSEMTRSILSGSVKPAVYVDKTEFPRIFTSFPFPMRKVVGKLYLDNPSARRNITFPIKLPPTGSGKSPRTLCGCCPHILISSI